ncbi:TIGR04255 family protein [Reyranella sp.]|uniref:TIGR04255 family protein n=1 Tax=Reyranella sp. TaxID=1929291 RepID=UPI003524974D
MASIDELFPPSPREHYRRAGDVLAQVLCQVRYPRVLRLEQEAPSSFQESLIKSFPLYERTANVQLPQGVQVSPEVLQLLAGQAGDTTHRFLSEDRGMHVTLTPEAMSVVASGSSYTTWENFRDLVDLAVRALTTSYKNPFFIRIGLRYQDVIHRESLGLHPDNSAWIDLINPALIGHFPFAKFEPNVVTARTQFSITLPDNTGRVLLRHGLVKQPPREGLGYALDFDFSCQPKIEINDVSKRLEHFHDLAGRAFRWSCTPQLRAALEPVEASQLEPHRAARA